MYEQFILIFSNFITLFFIKEQKIVLYLYSIFIFYFFLSLFNLYMNRNNFFEKENIYKHILYIIIYIYI